MKKIRYGIIGAGEIAERDHLPVFKSLPQVELVALCDMKEESLSKLSEKFCIPLLFSDHKRMLSEAELDAVSICTPNFLHSSQTIDCLNAGCHVLCEKPMATKVKEAEKMVRVAERKKKNLMIPFRFQFSPEAQKLKRVITQGELGEIYYAQSSWIAKWSVFREKDSWFTRKEKSGGGCLIDIGVYMINVTLWLMGNPEVYSVSASTYQRLKASTKVNDVEDLALALIKLKNGATLFIEISWALNADCRVSVTLCGDKGGASLYPLRIHRRKKERLMTVAPQVPKKNGFASIAREFISSIREEREPEANGKQGLEITRIIESIYASAECGKTIYL